MQHFFGVLLVAVFVFYVVSAHDITLDQYEVVSVDLGDTVVKVYHNRNIFPEHHKRGSIFFAHGNSASHKVWEHQLTDESFNRRFNLYAVDFPGHGASTFSTDPNYRYTAAGYAAFMGAVVQQLGITDCVFVGWSLGGHLMLESFQREEVFRQAAKAVVIHGTPPITTVSDILAGFIWTDPAQQYFSQAVVTEPEATVAVTAFFRPHIAEHPGLYAPIIAEWTQQFLATDGVARYIVNHNPFGDEVNTVESLLAQSSTPIAIFHGREDRLINATYIEGLVPHIPTLWESSIHYVESAGHAPFWERPGVYNELLDSFVDTVFDW